MKRRLAIAITIFAVLCVAVFALVNTRSFRVACHQWRMNSAYNTLFGNPEPVRDGLASHDVTGIDVDAVMATYEFHRGKLVDLNVLTHLQADFPELASDGTERQSDARSAFVHRMWNRFPGHKHYYLAGGGSFETWVPSTAEAGWTMFIESEVSNSLTDDDNGNSN